MAVRETEEEVRARLAQVAPGARVTSSYRTPERNAAVGGVPNSLHTRRGEGGSARALDIVPGSSGLSMAELNRRIGESGLSLQERLNEGDHVHVGFDGRPSQRRTDAGPAQSDVRRNPDGSTYRVVRSEDITPDEADRLVAGGEYQRDSLTGAVFRVVAAPTPEPMDIAYAQRQEERESLALDQQQADLMAQVAATQPSDRPGTWLTEMFGATSAQAATGGLEGVIVGESGDVLDRSMGQRFVENLDDAFNRSGAGYLSRMLDPNANGFDLADIWHQPEIVEGKPMDWVLDRVLGEDRNILRSVSAAERFDAPAIAAERARQAEYADRARRDPVRNAGDAAAAIGGQLAGSAVSPENWVAPGPTVSAKIAANAGIAAATDGLLQGAEIASGTRDEFSPVQTVASAAVGGALPAVHAVVQRAVVARRVQAQARGLQEDPVLQMAEAAARGQELQDSVRSAMGNPAGQRFRVRPEVESPVITPFQTKVDNAAGAVASTSPRDVTASVDNVFDINLARISTPEDVQAAIVGMADRFAKDADLARRGTRSWEQTQAAAAGVDWVKSMGERRVGQAVNAETALAYRTALNSSATQLLDLARKVEAEPTLANQYAFRRATAAHYAIQNELLGARAEAGRALNAFKISTDAPATYLRQVDSLIADAGGANSARELARKVIDAADRGDVELNQMVRGGALARSRDIIKLVYTNSLLSGAGTSIVNTVGNSMMLGMNLTSRWLSPYMARAFGGQASTQVGEAGAIVHGYQQALRDMFRLNPVEAAQRIGDNAGEALRRDGLFRGMAPGLDDAAPNGIKLRAEREEAGMRSGRPLSAAAWGVSEDTTLGRFLDIAQMLAEAPSNINALTDDVFKTISARGELHAQAFRRVASEGLEGEAARARYAELIRDPDDDMLAAAEREMHDLTFTRETPGMADAISQLRRHMDNNPTPIPFGTVMLPFVKTPANLISMGMRYSPLAPFSRRFRDDFAAGGARAETAKAQMAIGTALWSVWMGAALDGNITGAGPGNPGQREAMQRQDEFGGSVFQPYSVKIGERWFSYERADPLGQGMGLVADMADLMKNGDWDSDRNGEADEIAAHGVMALGSAFFDKTMLRSASEFTAAILNGTDAEAEKLMMNRAAGAIPLSGALRMTRRGEDPYLRETWNVASAMRNTVPGLSDDLPPQRDLWGKERTYQTGLGTLYDAIVPVQTRAAGGSAIDLEILNNGVSVAMPSRNISVMGETVSLKNRPDIYSEFLRLSGQPAFEQLNAVVEGRHPDSDFYLSLTDGPDGGKAQYIRDVISAYRNDARAQILDMYSSDLQAMAADRMRRREQVRLSE